MDHYLVEYLKSGRAWLLVGSGPSTAMGYPSWENLAVAAVALCRLESAGGDLAGLEAALKSGDYSNVFERSAALVGMPRLLQHLRGVLRAHLDGSPYERIYEYIARWPIPVYLTTNFDHEIERHLSKIGEQSYIGYSNTEDHLSFLLPDISGVITHLHGDLRSEAGLILTTSQYHDILSGSNWEYWRTKMTSIFQMNPVIVLGHSLSDPHIRHVLEAAKKGASVLQPVCWIAPDVDHKVVREYLERYRIRVITYDNRDRTHQNLVRLVESVSDFVPPRLAVHLGDSVARSTTSPLGANAAAPGFFVFTKLSAQADFETKRIHIMVAALRAAVPGLSKLPSFSIKQALEISGWPSNISVPPALGTHVAEQALAEGVLAEHDGAFVVGPRAQALAKVDQDRFQHLRSRFNTSLQNRLRRDFPSLLPEQVAAIAVDIEASLTGYFREGGLTLASTLAATADNVRSAIPSSMLRFINDASAKYDDHLRRQAFSTVSLQAFIKADNPEREYLGRISQGFFAFHLLGVFGEPALERLRHAKGTVWLVDSSAQIAATAVGSAANAVFQEAFRSSSELGMRLFTLERLFDETKEHLWFADHIVREKGASSSDVLAAAMGDLPYRKGNLFLEGFVNWQGAGNPADWDRYLAAIGQGKGVGLDSVGHGVRRLGIESIVFRDWPGFTQEDYAETSEFTEKIVSTYGRRLPGPLSREENTDLYEKATPEAEALVVVLHERDGKYHMLSPSGEISPAWFLSRTSILNSVSSGAKITWQPEAFVRFASTLAPASDEKSASRAFEVLLWSLAQSGVTVLDERIVTSVFGGIIDQAKLSITEQHSAYEQALGEKYGEPIHKVLERIPALHQPLAALQLANERADRELFLRVSAEALATQATKRATVAESELSAVQKYRRKLRDKQKKAERRKRKAHSRPKKKPKKKRR